MYGGVSLAIYMNGVANELFRAVRGRGVYKLFKTLTESDLVVDVVSGASAGGINGMFLAFALCNELEFSECANLWRRHGDIKDLLRKPDSPVRSQTSLLDSEEYYEPHLAAAFEQMWTHRIDAKQEKGAPSRSNELDLFVAGTDFNGRRSTTVDSAAHVIDVKDYRAKFWLKHRAGRKTQLDPRADALGRRDTPALAVAPNAATEALPRTGFSALAKLARITSCFPAAFAPVSLEVPPRATADQVDTPTTAVARKLGVWGLLEPGQYHFLDGGILDNKPFTSTIQAIFYRMANRPVQRHLLYVEPDPERFQDEQPRVPNFLSSAIDSLTRLPSYESIAGDLQDIGKHNDSIESYKRTCAELRNWVMRGPTRRSEPPGAPGHGRQGDAARAIYDRARLQSLADQVAQGLLSLEPGSRLDDDAKALLAKLRHALDQAIAQAESRMCGSRAVANGLFQRYDVEFRLRRLMHLTYVLMPAIRESPERATQQTHSEGPEPQGAPPVPTPVELLEPADSQLALYEIGHRVALLEIVRAKLLSAIEQNAPEWRRLKPGDVWGVVLDRLDVVLDIAELPPAVLEALRGERPCQEQLESLSKALEPRTRPGYNPAAGPRTSLLSLVDQGEAAIVGGFEAACAQKSRGSQQRPVEHEYLRFEALDQVLFPIQYVAGLREQDIIRTVRVSPLDAQRGCSAGKFSEKVTGETLAHFGAFLKRSWRSNDILYGRLDGACQLLETLLNPSWLRTALAVPDQRRRVLSAFGVLATEQQDNALARSSALRHWLDTEEIFPNAGKEATARAAEALAVLLDPEPSEFEPRIAGAAHAELLNALVEATHFSIVYDDYAKLIEDSIDEQLAWRSGKVGSSAPPDAAAPAAPTSVKSAPAARRPQFDPQTRAFDLTLDNLVVQAAAQQFAKDALAQRDTQALVTLLQKHPVGKESIQDDIPPSVLLELTAHTLLVLRNCILNSLGPRRSEAVRSQRIYRVFVDWPLRALYALANLIRERPAHGGIALGLLAYFLLAVIVDVCVFDSLWALAGWRGYVTSFALIALPLSCLAAAAGLVAASEYSWKSARSSYLLLARHILLWIVRVGAALAALVPIYIAYAYVAGWVSVALAGVLCRLPWFPGCNDSGSVVVLSTAAAVSFFVGKLTARRPLHSPASAAREEDDESSRNTTGGGDPPSSATGTRPLAVAAE